MIHKAESAAKLKKMFLLSFFFFFVGCADTRWPTWLSGEPGEEVLNAPRAVARPDSVQQKEWPYLGEVPTKKPSFSDPKDLLDREERLRSENLKAQADLERIRNIPLPEPMNAPVSTEEKMKTENESSSDRLETFFALRP